jgi:hypothetical protein
MSSDDRTEEQKQREKLLTRLDKDFLTELYEAETHKERVDLLMPLAVAMLWDSGQISNAGMNREVHERYITLTRKIDERLHDVDISVLSPQELEVIATERGVRDEVLEAEKIWKDSEESRILVRQYIAEKKDARRST